MNYTKEELELLASLATREGNARVRDNEARDMGLCPTMMRDLGQGPRQDADRCFELAGRLRAGGAGKAPHR